MTAPAAIIASFVQPAARLAMGDTVGGAVGGFEALLAMLGQAPQVGADGQATVGGETVTEISAETPAETGDLAALLGQAGASAWLTQAMSQAAPEETATPVTCAVPAAKGPPVDAATVLPQTETEADATDEGEGQATAADLEALLAQHKPEPVDPALLERIKSLKGQTAAQSLQSLMPATPAPAEPVAPAAVETADPAVVQLTAIGQTPAPGATVAAPVAPPVEARATTQSRKAAPVSDGKGVKVETANAASAATSLAAAGEVAEAESDVLAPVEVVAQDAETAEAPVRNPDASFQALTARLDAAAAGASALAAQVRGAPETVAKFAAGILDKLEGQSTKFDLQLDPHGLGKVDVSVEIGADGKLTAQMGFDSAVGLNELRGRAQELRTALEQAGFSLAEGALTFDFSGERRQQQAADSQSGRSEQAGKAFARAQGALDEEQTATPIRYQARRGLDLLI